jgi:hypothetical protein
MLLLLLLMLLLLMLLLLMLTPHLLFQVVIHICFGRVQG